MLPKLRGGRPPPIDPIEPIEAKPPESKEERPDPEAKGCWYMDVVSPRARRGAVPVPGSPGRGACRASLRVPAKRACRVLPNLGGRVKIGDVCSKAGYHSETYHVLICFGCCIGIIVKKNGVLTISAEMCKDATYDVCLRVPWLQRISQSGRLTGIPFVTRDPPSSQVEQSRK